MRNLRGFQPNRLLMFLVSWLFTIFSAQVDAQTILVGVYQNEPKVFTTETGQPAGIFVDVIEHIAKKEGWQLRYVAGTWAEGLERLARGEIDLMPDVAYTADREKIFSFHQEPVLSSWVQIYAHPGAGIKSILDLNGRKIAVLEQSVQQQAFEKLAASFGLQTTIIPLPDYEKVFMAVLNGKADAAVANNFYGAKHFRKFGLEDTAVVFSPSTLFFAALKNTRQGLLNTLDKSLREMKSNVESEYYRSVKRWISEDVRLTIPHWLKNLSLVAGAILVMSLAGSLVLNRQVQTRTQELKILTEELENRVRERTAELQVAMERAQAADRIKSAFLATMSHELRTPLNSIIGFTGIMIQGLAGPLNEEQKKQMNMVQGSSRHLLALINDVLDISKIEAGQLRLSFSTFDPRGSIEKMIKLVSPLAEKKKLDLRLDLADNLPAVTSDQCRFEQVILNLVNNAVKYSDRGHVIVKSCLENDRTLLVAVSDTGIGIKKEDLSHLFQPFHQVDMGLSRKYEGTGLGLSITRKLLDLMKGTICVESEFGQGSTFTIRLPLSPEGVT